MPSGNSEPEPPRFMDTPATPLPCQEQSPSGVLATPRVLTLPLSREKKKDEAATGPDGVGTASGARRSRAGRVYAARSPV